MNGFRRPFIQCFPGGSHGRYCGSSPRDVQINVQPVWGEAIAFCLPYAMAASGILSLRDYRNPPPNPANSDPVPRNFFARWCRANDELWEELARHEITVASAEAKAASLSGGIIGWSATVASNRVCTCVDTTLAVLSRRVCNLYVGSRAPVYNVQAFEVDFFCVDDPRFVNAPNITVGSKSWMRL